MATLYPHLPMGLITGANHFISHSVSEMPYKLRKAPNRPLYWVVAEDGRHMSKDPLPLERAKRQLRALYANVRR